MAVSRAARRPAVTVAMTVYNQAPYVVQAVRSVLRQTYRNLELIVVDDASRDGTASLLRSIHDPRLRLVLSQTNAGKARRMNQMLRLARGRYLLEVDGDDWLSPHAVAVLVSRMSRLPSSVGLIYGDRRYHIQTRGGPRPAMVRPGPTFRSTSEFLKHPRVGGPRFYRVAALRKVGGWPTNYPSGGRLAEDLALMLKLVEHYDFQRVPQVLYNIRRHGRNTTRRFAGRFPRVTSYLVGRARRQAGLPLRLWSTKKGKAAGRSVIRGMTVGARRWAARGVRTALTPRRAAVARKGLAARPAAPSGPAASAAT